MKYSRMIIATAAMSGALATGAFAADPANPDLLPDRVPIADFAEPGFGWDGFYAGVGLSGSSLTNGTTDTTGYLDLIAGLNVTTGNILFGAEGWVGGYSVNTGASGVEGGAEARAGYLIDPNVLTYVSGGGLFYDNGDNYGFVGGGVEFVATDNVTIDVEYKYLGWSNSGQTGHAIGASALWHF